eukprot:COSAG06_NODE_15581_length_1060_cov_1.458897_1_plen_45_part_10
MQPLAVFSFRIIGGYTHCAVCSCASITSMPVLTDAEIRRFKRDGW